MCYLITIIWTHWPTLIHLLFATSLLCELHMSLQALYQLLLTAHWYAPWPFNCVKCTSGWLSMHIQSLHIFVIYLDFYQGFPIFSMHILDFSWLCINSFIFVEHSDISTYHMMSSSDPTTWYWAPYV
jgi:hypothetical protein